MSDAMRDAMSDAYDKVEDKPAEGTSSDPDPITTPQEMIDDKTPEIKDAIEPESGASETKEVEAKEVEAKGKEDPTGEPKDEESTSIPAPEERMPAGVSAAVKAIWKDIPKLAQEEMLRRETAYTQGIEQYANASRYGEQMQQVLAPYAQAIAVEGVDAPAMVGNLMQTVAMLQSGPAHTKAEIIHRLIQTYGVDVPMVDALITGQQPLSEEETRANTAFDQRMRPFEDFMHNQQALAGQAVTAQGEVVNSEVLAFENDPKNEFISQVKGYMADILELSDRQGAPMSLQDCYDKAVLMHPEVSKVVKARQQAAWVKDNQDKVAAKLRAASSVATTSTADEGGVPGADLRSSLNAAIEAQEG